MSATSRTTLKLSDNAEEQSSESSKKERIVHLNTHQVYKYRSNKISTAKYNVISFLPKFLFEEFQRYSNLFFLLIALLQQIPNVSPSGRFTTIVPLTFILTVSALKELVEDVKRHRADDAVNKKKVQRLEEGEWKEVMWRQICVGDIVRVTNGSYFPGDLLFLSSSDPENVCYIETANLDGETNLKIRQGHPLTVNLRTTKDLSSLQGSVNCDLPNCVVYEFTGQLKLTHEEVAPVKAEHVLLRGAKLRNTVWAYGVVLYAGHETKLMMNVNAPPFKRSTIERITNRQILMLFVLLLILCLISAIASTTWVKKNASKSWYLGLGSSSYDESSSTITFTFLTFVILYNNLIPISLQVTLELVRFIQALFINMDIDMYYEETDIAAMARTSNLNEELGCVEYIFSDKTGTLTQNCMIFKSCTIAGTVYEVSETGLNITEVTKILKSKNSHSEYVREFLTALALCHTVVPEKDAELDDYIYQASSPDETALLSGAKELGFVCTARTTERIKIKIINTEEAYEILNVLEFSSDRRRMSIIVKTPNGQIRLYCKGADSVIYELLESSPQFSEDTQDHLDAFSRDGLRTLCVGYADISPGDYEEWNRRYQEASTATEMRDQKLEEAAERIEQNLKLLGASGVEDKLQDGVPEAIFSFLKAGIKFWVLTGDKQETAINIGYSCKLLSNKSYLLKMNAESLTETTECIKRRLDYLEDPELQEHEAALITDGKTLKFALLPEVKEDFLKLALLCKVVICCRVAPIQKAEVVELVQSSTKVVTLAIGDGANDVAMIQAARVGIGLRGVEGQQAASASDYAIAQFRFLTKLLFVHGAWNLERLSKLILYSFHKNVCLYMIELWFAIVSAWSGQIVFQRWTIGLYNLIFTAAPPLAMGLFDRTCSAEARLRIPSLYDRSKSPTKFNLRVFWIWVLNSILHSSILFWGTYFMMREEVVWCSGRTGSILALGNMVYTYVIVAVSLKAGLMIHSWIWLTHLAIWGSIASWFVFLYLYSLCWPKIPIAPDISGEGFMMLTSNAFWFGFFLIPTATLLGDVCFQVLRRTISETLAEEVMECEARDPSFFTK